MCEGFAYVLVGSDLAVYAKSRVSVRARVCTKRALEILIATSVSNSFVPFFSYKCSVAFVERHGEAGSTPGGEM